MIYLTVSDLLPHIKTNILCDLLEIDTIDTGATYSILDDIETHALAEMHAYIANYYDWDKLISGSTKSQTFNHILIDIVFYNLHTRVESDRVPQFRILNYQSAVQLLKDIALRRVSPQDWVRKNASYTPSTIFLSSSDIKINGQY